MVKILTDEPNEDGKLGFDRYAESLVEASILLRMFLTTTFWDAVHYHVETQHGSLIRLFYIHDDFSNI